MDILELLWNGIKAVPMYIWVAIVPGTIWLGFILYQIDRYINDK